ncbi:hypothetical protein CLAFUR4_12319 [Fulvia fulva]|nr:hypothetical protein CLAFUR4_12319 [Fulvia fulva]WPV33647.1 hypothetical protein CLAFUW7_12321 [Fulvia fulva]
MSVPNGGAPTPRRQTRAASSRQQTPLPALQTKQSHAYGAPGKTHLNSQMTTDTAEIDAAFTTTGFRRTRAATAKEPTPAPAATPAAETTTRTRKSKKRVEPEVLPEEDLEDETNDGDPNGIDSGARGDGMRPDTRLDTSLSYDKVPEPQKRATAPKEPSPSLVPSVEPARQSPVEQVEALPEDVEPWRITVLFWTFWKYAVPSAQIFFVLLLGFVIMSGLLGGLGLFASLLPLPAMYALKRDVFFYRVGTLLYGHGTPAEALWYNVKNAELTMSEIQMINITNVTLPQNQYLINQNVYARLTNDEWAARLLKETVDTHGETLRELKRILPPLTAMITEDGQWKFTNDFLQAYGEKMLSSDAAPLWDKFMEINEERLIQAHRGILQTEVNGVIENMQIVTHDQMQQAIVENNDYMMANFNETVASFRTHLVKEFRGIAIEVADDAIKQSPLARLQNGAVAYATIIQNAQKRMREVNYLSIGLGAMVVPLYTSPTYKNPVLAQGWVDWVLYRTGLKTWPLLPFVPALPPTSALRDWKEGAECWCAAPSGDEMALGQIAIQYPHKIYPGEFALEHIPASGTRDIAAAPKKYEVWAQVDNSTEALRVKALLDQDFDLHFDWECGPPPKHNPSRWVCIVADEYDIHSSNYIRSYDLRVGAERIGLTTQMIAVRVVENWGSPDHTCIYRVRMTGKEVEA